MTGRVPGSCYHVDAGRDDLSIPNEFYAVFKGLPDLSDAGAQRPLELTGFLAAPKFPLPGHKEMPRVSECQFPAAIDHATGPADMV
jgi:hypothetical protein